MKLFRRRKKWGPLGRPRDTRRERLAFKEMMRRAHRQASYEWLVRRLDQNLADPYRDEREATAQAEREATARKDREALYRAADQALREQGMRSPFHFRQQ